MSLRCINEIDIKDKSVFLRLDLNVPLDDEGNIKDDTRIRAALKTIRYGLDHGARLIIASHLGRPKGERNPKYSLQPVAQKLAEILECEIIFPEDCIGDAVKKLVSEQKPEQIILLENLRFHKEEEANDPNFSEKLASLADIYINDAFGTAHRAHASTEGITKYMEIVGAGFLMMAEVEHLGKLLKNPEKPFVAIIGGAKVSDKIGVIDSLLNQVSGLLIGGGMAYTFLKAKGFDIGKSLFEADKVHSAKKILERAQTRGTEILLPVDHIAAKELKEGVPSIATEDENIKDNLIGLDIGPRTIEKYSIVIARAATIFWNGPLGVCEISPFEKGTFSIARAVAGSKALSVVGGGDSIAAINRSGLSGKITHICTGGGASLKFLEGKKLPGIAALER